MKRDAIATTLFRVLLAVLLIMVAADGVRRWRSSRAEGRVVAALRDEDNSRCIDSLRKLSAKQPDSTTKYLVAALNGSDSHLRSRAAWSLTFLPLKQKPSVVAALAAHLSSDADSAVRRSCAVGLLGNQTTEVINAYILALSDRDEKVVTIACGELGAAGGLQATAGLQKMLEHPSWRVRLQACKGLIMAKRVDNEVVRALEKLARDPGAGKCDAELKEFDQILKHLRPSVHDIPSNERWDSLETMLKQARQMEA